MKPKKHFYNLVMQVFSCMIVVILLTSCSGNSNDNTSTEDVEVSDTDMSVQYYLPMNVDAWAQGQDQTTDDLRPSGRLLLTSGGNVKAAEFNNGYKKVYSFRCEYFGDGWYIVSCRLKNPTNDEDYNFVCYTRENL